VELAGKGLAERDNHPMPTSVKTPEAFYETMARAALDAVGLQALLERVARAERKLRISDQIRIQAVNQALSGWADAKAENARLRAMIVGRSPHGPDGNCNLVPEEVGDGLR
jgi:hypothetical protein